MLTPQGKEVLHPPVSRNRHRKKLCRSENVARAENLKKSRPWSKQPEYTQHLDVHHPLLSSFSVSTGAWKPKRLHCCPRALAGIGREHHLLLPSVGQSHSSPTIVSPFIRQWKGSEKEECQETEETFPSLVFD